MDLESTVYVTPSGTVHASIFCAGTLYEPMPLREADGEPCGSCGAGAVEEALS